jgi:hypothetical protein
MSKKPDPHPGRKRLQKSDLGIIAQALEFRGYTVRRADDRIEAWDPLTDRYVCGFYWRPATKAKAATLPFEAGDGFPAHPGTPAQPAVPGGWRFDIAFSDCFSLKDLKTAMREANRVRRLVPECRTAWAAFSGSKSEKRWVEYRSHVAALFMRQDAEDDPCDGS